MHRSRLSTFVLDCKTTDLDAAAEFWSRALGRRWRPEPEGDPLYRLLDSDPSEPILFVQKVEHESRIHLDIETDALEAEARRLEALGARRMAYAKRWILMDAPTGQGFSILDPPPTLPARHKPANVGRG